MAAEYTYRVSAWWTSGRTGLAKCESSPNTIHFSEAAELGGLQGRWTPEQLLLCALAGCFTTTFMMWREARSSSTPTWRWRSKAVSTAHGPPDATSMRFSFVPG